MKRKKERKARKKEKRETSRELHDDGENAMCGEEEGVGRRPPPRRSIGFFFHLMKFNQLTSTGGQVTLRARVKLRRAEVTRRDSAYLHASVPAGELDLSNDGRTRGERGEERRDLTASWLYLPWTCLSGERVRYASWNILSSAGTGRARVSEFPLRVSIMFSMAATTC